MKLEGKLMNLLRDRYKLLKIVTVGLGALGIPLATYVGICFARGDHFRFGLLLGLEIALYTIDTCIYFWILEQIPVRALKKK